MCGSGLFDHRWKESQLILAEFEKKYISSSEWAVQGRSEQGWEEKGLLAEGKHLGQTKRRKGKMEEKKEKERKRRQEDRSQEHAQT